jgi:hypothetical protein
MQIEALLEYDLELSDIISGTSHFEHPSSIVFFTSPLPIPIDCALVFAVCVVGLLESLALQGCR